MEANSIGQPSEVIVEAIITRCPTSKYLKPGADPVEDHGEIAYWNKSLRKRLAHRLHQHFRKRGTACK